MTFTRRDPVHWLWMVLRFEDSGRLDSGVEAVLKMDGSVSVGWMELCKD